MDYIIEYKINNIQNDEYDIDQIFKAITNGVTQSRLKSRRRTNSPNMFDRINIEKSNIDILVFRGGINYIFGKQRLDGVDLRASVQHYLSLNVGTSFSTIDLSTVYGIINDFIAQYITFSGDSTFSENFTKIHQYKSFNIKKSCVSFLIPFDDFEYTDELISRISSKCCLKFGDIAFVIKHSDQTITCNDFITIDSTMSDSILILDDNNSNMSNPISTDIPSVVVKTDHDSPKSIHLVPLPILSTSSQITTNSRQTQMIPTLLVIKKLPINKSIYSGPDYGDHKGKIYNLKTMSSILPNKGTFTKIIKDGGIVIENYIVVNVSFLIEYLPVRKNNIFVIPAEISDFSGWISLNDTIYTNLVSVIKSHVIYSGFLLPISKLSSIAKRYIDEFSSRIRHQHPHDQTIRVPNVPGGDVVQIRSPIKENLTINDDSQSDIRIDQISDPFKIINGPINGESCKDLVYRMLKSEVTSLIEPHMGNKLEVSINIHICFGSERISNSLLINPEITKHYYNDHIDGMLRSTLEGFLYHRTGIAGNMKFEFEIQCSNSKNGLTINAVKSVNGVKIIDYQRIQPTVKHMDTSPSEQPSIHNLTVTKIRSNHAMISKDKRSLKVRNPKSNRMIDVDGKVFTNLIKDGYIYSSNNILSLP